MYFRRVNQKHLFCAITDLLFLPGRLLRICLVIAPGLLLSLTGCAYFNTYYNAETAFKQAQKSHQKVLRNYPDSIVVEPPSDARTNYDRAVEKSIKVIDVYPKAKKWHDDAVFLMAKSYFYKKEMSKAIRRFRDLQQEYPASPFIPESYVFLAKAYIEDGSLVKAEEVLSQARDRYPMLDKDEQVTQLLVEIAIRREGRSQAIDLLEKMRKSVKSDDKKLDLLLRISELYIETKQYDKAIVLLKKAPRLKDLPFQLFRVDQALLTCYLEKKELKTALDFVNSMARNKLYKKRLNEILYNKAIILKNMGNIDESVVVLKQICGLPSDSASVAADTSSIIGKAYFELACIYQQNKGDYKEAKELFAKASKARDTTIAPVAAKRLSSLERLEKLRAAADSADTSISPADYRYQAGEILRYELDEPDSAFYQFLALCADTGTDSTIVPRSLCAAAQIARHSLCDTVRSDSLFNLVIARFPSSEYAVTAQREMKQTVTIETRSAAADRAFRRAENLYFDENDVKGAVKAYYDVYKTYPELDIAPKSLFVAAWLSDNVLQKNKTAKSLYERICEKYSETVYCQKEAKPRIRVVLDTLEAIKLVRKKAEADEAAKVKVKPKKGAATVVAAPGTRDSSQENDDSFLDDTPETATETSGADGVAAVAKSRPDNSQGPGPQTTSPPPVAPANPLQSPSSAEASDQKLSPVPEKALPESE